MDIELTQIEGYDPSTLKYLAAENGVLKWLQIQQSGGGNTIDAATTAYMNALGIPNDTTKYYSSTAQEITGADIWQAVDTFVKGLKSAALWTKIPVIYPVIGGTAARHKFNLKNPLDTNAANRLSMFGGITHSATGMLFDGTGYADTFLNPSTDLDQNAGAMGYYSRTNNTAQVIEMGAVDGSKLFQMHVRYDNMFYPNPNTDAGNAESTANTNSSGFFQAVRTGATTTFGQRNATATQFTGRTFNSPNLNVVIGGRRNGSNVELRTNREFAGGYIGNSLTTTDATNLYNLIQALQTALHRQV